MDPQFNFDADYLARLRARDPETLNHFCDYFYIAVRNKVRHQFHGPDVEDLLQDVFLACLKRIDAGEPRVPQKLPGYVFGVCRNLIFRGYNANGNENHTADLDVSTIADLVASAEATLIRGLDAHSVHDVLQHLSPRDRDIINRVFFLEQDRATIAREMGVTRENVRLILFHALQRFRRKWDIIQQKGPPDRPRGADQEQELNTYESTNTRSRK